METVAIEGSVRERVTGVLAGAPLFAGAGPADLAWASEHASLCRYREYERLVVQGDPSDSFFVIIEGEGSVLIREAAHDWHFEVGRVKPPGCLGEMGLLLGEPRTATVAAVGDVLALRFAEPAFREMFQRVPAFGRGISRFLAQRLKDASLELAVDPVARRQAADPALRHVLPIEFVLRHRVVPLEKDDATLLVGCVEGPTLELLAEIRSIAPGLEVRSVPIRPRFFNEALQAFARPPRG